MPALPVETTARTWVHYTNGTDEHVVMFRHPDALSLTALNVYIDQWLAALDPIIYEITILGERQAASGSTVSNPVVWDGSATYGDGAMPTNAAPIEYRFEGRANDGRRASWSMFSGKLAIPSTYRYLTSDNVNVANAFSSLDNMADNGDLLVISGEVPVIYPYMNYQFNSYWETNRRG